MLKERKKKENTTAGQASVTLRQIETPIRDPVKFGISLPMRRQRFIRAMKKVSNIPNNTNKHNKLTSLVEWKRVPCTGRRPLWRADEALQSRSDSGKIENKRIMKQFDYHFSSAMTSQYFLLLRSTRQELGIKQTPFIFSSCYHVKNLFVFRLQLFFIAQFLKTFFLKPMIHEIVEHV